MSRTEKVELTVLCLLHQDGHLMLDDNLSEFQYVIEDGEWGVKKN